MRKEQRMSTIMLNAATEVIKEVALVHATNECELGHDEIQEILYRLSPVVAIGRRFGQGRPIEPIDEIEMDIVREQVQDRFFDELNALKDV